MSRQEVKINKLIWLHIDQVTEEDTRYLQNRFRFHLLDLKDCLGTTQRPKVDFYPRYAFFVFHFPYYDEQQQRIRIHELMVFAGRQYLVTVTNEPLPTLRKYWNSFVSKSKRAVSYDPLKNNSGYLLYKILDVMYRQYLPIIDSTGELVTDLEDKVYTQQDRETVFRLAVARRQVLTIRRILEPQVLIVGRLVAAKYTFFSKDLEVYFDDVHDYLEKALITVDAYKDTIEGLHETNQSLLTQRTNDTIKTLTVISVALLPLTVITGYYGMNVVGLPFATHDSGLWIITILLVGLFLGIIGIARRQRLM
ncbi:MAG: magnesium transporter CorA family protein [Patescibacteria group bacterium]|jgi:magnesium transporter